MKNYKFSVVIPVYNTQEYLDECIGSVVNQSYSNWELFLIDDGSTDNSYEICKKYRKLYGERVYIQKNKNRGVSYSRNVALKKIQGDYVIFLDSDDYLMDLKFFENLNKLINKTGVDCYIGNFKSFTESSNIEPLIDKEIDKKQINKKKHEKVLEYLYRLRLVFTVWRFIVKADIIRDNNLLMVDGIIHEDEEWCVRMLICCNTFWKLDEPHYMYRKREQSIMTYNHFKHFDNYLIVCKILLGYAQQQTEHYKKIFVQRCAYKCAGQVYYGLKDISEFLPPIKNEKKN